ncbi:branched-chain amino acid ABC transporter permease (plasmid) [Agrobacterium leguminum]|uniref:Branched-chain amino acid ABC superfamily ATP binding cassette transporter, permease protein n=1 Tax=Agrobacterium deltaense NCPPB 1641 TaxID=1183425 RepID=A0A1S7U749_9HYPH|nr:MULTISPECIES: branched-chain amino acid ABC transporter permease [Agrobacterium]WFS69818.1 branched-chain amino acid ABC transporter permease [Agrobacterium leguminum]CVI62639.1 Branched-chain amino acid ABC superfamily ATP binding cassette transporter, permease protein [Agrobacterium deltaense NCPPB 1641]
MIIGTAKESYREDEALLTTRTQKFWMGILILTLLILPVTFNSYWTYLACLVLINIIAATGLNILTGFTGLVSLGHAAFMAVGAYTVAFLARQFDFPVLLNVLAGGCMAAGAGVVVGLPSLRVKGLYLAIATISASFIFHFVFVAWESVTGGSAGITIAPAILLGTELVEYRQLYWLILPICLIMVTGAANLFRNRIGRALIAIRDRDISAEVLGIATLRYKLMSFALASFYAGIAGGLWAYFFRVVTPDSFPFATSIFMLAAIIVGGMGSILGGVLGAIFMTLVPELLRFVMELFGPWFPNAAITLSPIRTISFGALIVGFLIFEPQGLAEVVRRVRRFFRLWPFRT